MKKSTLAKLQYSWLLIVLSMFAAVCGFLTIKTITHTDDLLFGLLLATIPAILTAMCFIAVWVDWKLGYISKIFRSKE